MKGLSYKDIKRLKHITDYITGKAYLNIKNNEFILNYPNSQKSNIMDSKTNELIVLYQRIGNKKDKRKNPRYITHLVRPIDDIFIDNHKDENFRYGRRVEVIAYTKEENKIPFKKTLLAKIGFKNMFGSAKKITKLAKNEDIEIYQKELWSLFQPFFEHGLNPSSNDIMGGSDEEDIEVKEGNVILKQHLVKERNNSIIRTKKELALRNGDCQCEVCGFSFIDTYGQNYIECHHIVPIHLGERITKLEDLALVCSNCHRMLHRKIDGEYLSIKGLKQLISN